VQRSVVVIIIVVVVVVVVVLVAAAVAVAVAVGVAVAVASPNAPPEPAQCHRCHACHAKRRWMSPSATPATQNEGGRRQVPRLPRDKLCVTKLWVTTSCV